MVVPLTASAGSRKLSWPPLATGPGPDRRHWVQHADAALEAEAAVAGDGQRVAAAEQQLADLHALSGGDVVGPGIVERQLGAGVAQVQRADADAAGVTEGRCRAAQRASGDGLAIGTAGGPVAGQPAPGSPATTSPS